MSSLKMTLSFIAALVAVFLCIVEAAEGKSMSASTLSNIDGERGKRQIFDASCRGIYDRGLLGQLERVCEDCYNLYRKPAVATECRRDCYTSEIFESCLRDLMLHEYIDEYKEKAFMVAGRK